MSVCFFFTFLASLAASLSSLALSKTLYRREATTGGYLFFYFLTGFLISSFVNGIFSSTIPFNPHMTLLGAAVGLLIVGLMFAMGRAIQNGPSGLTFVFQNSGAILPPLLLSLVFNKPFGFTLSFGNLAGMILVILGLFFAAGSRSKIALRKVWVMYALIAFIVQGLILSIFQWRCLLIQEGFPSHVLIPFSCPPNADLWFMPAIFFSAWIYQAVYFSSSEKRLPRCAEVVGGSLGGIANGLSTFFLLRATLVASPTEKIMLFPLFTVTIILLCNLSGKLFYRETIPWKANILAAFGIFIGTAF